MPKIMNRYESTNGSKKKKKLGVHVHEHQRIEINNTVYHDMGNKAYVINVN